MNMTFEEVRNHQITKKFIEDTSELLEGYVIEDLPEVLSFSGSQTLFVEVGFIYPCGLKENRGLNKFLKCNGWKVSRRDLSGWREENKHFKYRAVKSFEIKDQ